MSGFPAHRFVAPEWLDQLPPQDAQAVESRRDLRRLNFWMGNVRAMRAALAGLRRGEETMRVAEMGTGDGTFLLRLARALGPAWSGTQVFLVDRRPCVTTKTLADFANIGWIAEVVAADIFDWLPAQALFDVLVANLFLHHFEADSLAALLRLAAQGARAVVACEPRRGWPALAVTHALHLLGCNAVTRHDAPISVRAGFRGRELSGGWPFPRWTLREERSGLFAHLFVARKEA